MGRRQKRWPCLPGKVNRLTRVNRGEGLQMSAEEAGAHQYGCVPAAVRKTGPK